MNITMLTENERDIFSTKLEAFAADDTTDGEMATMNNPPVHEMVVCEGDVELRAFPLDTNEMRIAVVVRDTASWYQNLTAYSRGNLRNGDEMYQSLDDELKSIVSDTLGEDVEFTANKGSRAFVAEFTH